MYYYYVTLRTLLSAPVYGIYAQGPSRYCILLYCIYIIALAIEGFGVKPDYP
jgi:hypothetical protein